jgi:hypothetical protein
VYRNLSKGWDAYNTPNTLLHAPTVTTPPAHDLTAEPAVLAGDLKLGATSSLTWYGGIVGR